MVAWDRLVRYVPEGSPSAVRYGEPIIEESQADCIAQLAEEAKLKVRVLQGDNPLNAKTTGETETVRKLLGPLEVKDVPIIRCIGLNYKSHSTCSLQPFELPRTTPNS